jgi:hypothetical protein
VPAAEVRGEPTPAVPARAGLRQPQEDRMSWKKCVGVWALLAAPSLIGCATDSVGKVEPPSEEEMTAKWMAFATPGDGHQALADRVGRWNGKVTMYMPGMPPMESTATSECRWLMDGRYLEDNTSGDFMGMPFQGRGCAGYDNMTGKYCWTWIDNFGTGFMFAEGTYDAATKTFEYHTHGPDVVRGRYVPMRMVERWIDRDRWLWEMYGPDYDGNEMKSMQIEYTRAN